MALVGCYIAILYILILFADQELCRIKNDVMNAVVKAFQIAEEIDASQKKFLEILRHGKEQYLRGFAEAVNFDYLWPRSWQSAIKMLEKRGYRDPEDYFICLHSCHLGHYSILNNSTLTVETLH